jgi:hypothetical protein
VSEPLRPISHPGQSETLVHFCGRARPSFAPEVVFLSPADRLSNIVAEGVLRAHRAPGSSAPVVCLSESDPDGVAAMLERSGFAGWGVVFRRQWVWDEGGGPVWYARSDAWPRIASTLDPDLMAWVVRTVPGEADWLHEREWRVSPSGGELVLDREGVVAFLVSDPEWEPRLVPGHTFNPETGGIGVAEVTPDLATEVPRWYWDGSRVWELPPVPLREDLLPWYS